MAYPGSAGFGGITTVAAATDTSFAALASGNHLSYNAGTGKWHNASPVTLMNDMSDVNTAGLSTNDVLTFTGANWTPVAGGAPAAHGARMTRTSFQSLPNLTATDIAMTATTYDTDSIISGSEFVIPSGMAGHWLFIGTSVFAITSSGNRHVLIQFSYDNGISWTLDNFGTILPSQSGNSAIQQAVTIQNMSVGHRAKLTSTQNSGGALNYRCWEWSCAYLRS